MMALFGTIILLPIYTQRVLGLDVLSTGLLLLPGGLLMGLLAPFVGRLYDSHGTTAAGHSRSDHRQRRSVVAHLPGRAHLVLVGAGRPHVAELRARAAVHAAVHRGTGGPETGPLLARQRDRRHGPAGRRRGRNRTVHHRDDHRINPAARGRSVSRGGDRRGNPQRLRLRRESSRFWRSRWRSSSASRLLLFPTSVRIGASALLAQRRLSACTSGIYTCSTISAIARA